MNAVESIQDNRNAILEERLQDQINKFDDLARIGTVITSLMDLDRVLPVVMESALDMVKGEVGEMVLFDTDGQIKSSVCWGFTSKVSQALVNVSDQDIWQHIFKTGQQVRIDNLPLNDEWKLLLGEFNITSFIACPMKHHNKVVGGAIIANKVDALNFSADDLMTLENICRFAAVSVVNSALHAQELAKQKLDANLEMAYQLQKTLLAKPEVDYGWLRINAHNKMAMIVGGDFYDIIEISPEKILVVVADVCNKGISAALLMTVARSLIRAFADEPIDLPKIITLVNSHICRDAQKMNGMFITMIMAYFDRTSGIVSVLNAGHPPGQLCYPNGDIVQLKKGGPFIGQFDDIMYQYESHPLQSGMRFFFYTDGAFEAADNKGRMLGLSGLKEFFAKNHGCDPAEFKLSFLELLSRFNEDEERLDDTTFLLADVR